MLVNEIFDEDEESDTRSLNDCSESCEECGGKVNYTENAILFIYNNDLRFVFSFNRIEKRTLLSNFIIEIVTEMEYY